MKRSLSLFSGSLLTLFVPLNTLAVHAQAPTTAQPQAIVERAPFRVKFDAGAIVSLRRADDKFDTEYVEANKRLGDITLRYHGPDAGLRSFRTKSIAAPNKATYTVSPDGTQCDAVYEVFHTVDNGAKPALPIFRIESRLKIEAGELKWDIKLHNLSAVPQTISDLALPLPMNTEYKSGQPATASVLKHSFISGNGSHLFWMRSNSVGPYLTMVPTGKTHLEYWDTREDRTDYRVFVHSMAVRAEARAQGTRWRQPQSEQVLAPAGKTGDSAAYGFKFRWAKDYDDVRQIIVDEGEVDVNVAPGMTVPNDLFARFALRSKESIQSVTAEFPSQTQLQYLGARGDYELYQVKFARLGENRLTVHYGTGKTMYLEFFSTEPLETLIKKRGAFIARHQFRTPNKWYNGLLAEWNMRDGVQLGPDNYDGIQSWRIYEVTCDDPGLSKPAYLAAKNAEYPVQKEVEALDYYLKNFVWGGLQRTTAEKYSYGIYGIPDWKRNRESSDTSAERQLHLWRPYDYPHIIQAYYGMYLVAKRYPHIKTALTAREYLQRAYGTANAMFTVPKEIIGWTAEQTGFYNELVIEGVIKALEDAKMTKEAKQLREHWERKVSFFVKESTDLFGSEYPFDSTGFESTHALAKYALEQAEIKGAKSPISKAQASEFMERQMAANLFCRGYLEPAYYYLGSDYRASGGDAYTLTYMAQMGGWAVLDYGLNFAKNPAMYLQLGYASYLSSWALMNTGTVASNYGYWYPGKENDGGAGGGFEPAPYGETWLDQPHHRGSWYYSCEIDLGFCGALRGAATVLTDDPIFGRFCYGGDLKSTTNGWEVISKDGLRKRFYVRLKGLDLDLTSDNNHFSSKTPIQIGKDLHSVRFALEPGDSKIGQVHVKCPADGRYKVMVGQKVIANSVLKQGQNLTFSVPIPIGSDVPISVSWGA